jgi:hypothetical protein
MAFHSSEIALDAFVYQVHTIAGALDASLVKFRSCERQVERKAEPHAQ